jgi:hypothetical protein
LPDLKTQRDTRIFLLAGGLIFAVSFLAYFLFIPKIGFVGDEWYMAYAARVGGVAKFIDVFQYDRPFRILWTAMTLPWLGLNPASHAYLSFALKVVGSFGIFWLLYQLFPKQKWLSVFLAALYAVYPGFMQQPVGWDYQTHNLIMALQAYSMAIMVAAWRSPKAWHRVILILVSVVFQLFSLLQMEWFIGLEGLRVLILIYLAVDGQRINTLWVKPRDGLKKAILYWLPYVITLLGYLYWRLAVFHSNRGTTDFGSMLGGFSVSPILKISNLISDLVRNFMNVVFSGWVVPFYSRLNDLRLRDVLVAGAAGIMATVLVLLALRWLSKHEKPVEGDPENRVTAWLFWIGVISVLFSLFPIIFAGREVNFETYSRFSYPGSIGAVLIIGAFLTTINKPSTRGACLAFLIGISVSANVANSIRYVEISDSIRRFWWQVSWRLPQIKPETMIIARYSAAPIAESNDVWGPASLIYYPEPYMPEGQIRTPLASVPLNNDTIASIRAGLAFPDRDRRGIILNQDLRNPLVISMPPGGSCVHVLDGKALELSRFEDPSIQGIAAFSDQDRVDLTSPAHVPPAEIFGQEPAHDWCYYFERASLARQKGDWSEVAQLGDEAIHQDLHPMDRAEWFPFIQAYGFLGQTDAARDIFLRMADDPYLVFQGCSLYSTTDPSLAPGFAAGREFLKETFCQ